ncbi:MAG: efflux RND transporter periplasmic adaptor subunit [Planctomycetota bacterium]
MRKWIIAAVVVILVGIVLSQTVCNDDAGDWEIIPATVENGPITMTIETSGTVEPLSTVQVGCEVTGKIVELLVGPDEPVKKDQIICRIDPELAEAENQQSLAEDAKAKSVLEDSKLARNEQIANLPVLTQQALAGKQEAEAALVDAEYTWNRVDKLRESGDAAETEWVAMKARYLRAKAALEAADAAHKLAVNNEKILPGRADQAVAQAAAVLQLAEARLNFTKTRVDRCTIRSPIDGIVLKQYFDVGTTVNATFQTPPLYLLAPSLSRMKVSAKVSESDISHIEVGQTTRFEVVARQPIMFQDEIKHKYNQPEILQNVVTYTVDFEVANDEHHTLIPGLSVNVEIICVDKPEVPQLANAALRFKPPLTLEDRRALIDAAVWPPKPATDVNGDEAIYCAKAHAWRFDEETSAWTVAPLWVGVTDNISTEILAGAKPGDVFVKKAIDKSESGFSLKETMKLARPENRVL